MRRLQRNVARFSPPHRFVCLSDVPIKDVETVPLKHDWPGWWSKMALFDPAIEGDIFCTDLDNVFLGPLDDILGVRPTAPRARGGATRGADCPL